MWEKTFFWNKDKRAAEFGKVEESRTRVAALIGKGGNIRIWERAGKWVKGRAERQGVGVMERMKRECR